MSQIHLILFIILIGINSAFSAEKCKTEQKKINILEDGCPGAAYYPDEQGNPPVVTMEEYCGCISEKLDAEVIPKLSKQDLQKYFDATVEEENRKAKEKIVLNIESAALVVGELFEYSPESLKSCAPKSYYENNCPTESRDKIKGLINQTFDNMVLTYSDFYSTFYEDYTKDITLDNPGQIKNHLRYKAYKKSSTIVAKTFCNHGLSDKELGELEVSIRNMPIYKKIRFTFRRGPNNSITDGLDIVRSRAVNSEDSDIYLLTDFAKDELGLSKQDCDDFDKVKKAFQSIGNMEYFTDSLNRGCTKIKKHIDESCRMAGIIDQGAQEDHLDPAPYLAELGLSLHPAAKDVEIGRILCLKDGCLPNAIDDSSKKFLGETSSYMSNFYNNKEGTRKCTGIATDPESGNGVFDGLEFRVSNVIENSGKDFFGNKPKDKTPAPPKGATTFTAVYSCIYNNSCIADEEDATTKIEQMSEELKTTYKLNETPESVKSESIKATTIVNSASSHAKLEAKSDTGSTTETSIPLAAPAVQQNFTIPGSAQVVSAPTEEIESKKIVKKSNANYQSSLPSKSITPVSAKKTTSKKQSAESLAMVESLGLLRSEISSITAEIEDEIDSINKLEDDKKAPAEATTVKASSKPAASFTGSSSNSTGAKVSSNQPTQQAGNSASSAGHTASSKAAHKTNGRSETHSLSNGGATGAKAGTAGKATSSAKNEEEFSKSLEDSGLSLDSMFYVEENEFKPTDKKYIEKLYKDSSGAMVYIKTLNEFGDTEYRAYRPVVASTGKIRGYEEINMSPRK